MIRLSGNTVDSPILKTDTITSDNSTIVLEKELSSSTEINITAPSINLNGNVDLIGNINHNGSNIFTEIQTQIDNLNSKKILTQNITMQVGVDKEFTHLNNALVEANKYSVGYDHSDPTIQYRITIQIDDGYDSDMGGTMKDLYLPHVDITCLGWISEPNASATFKDCTFGSINLYFMVRRVHSLAFVSCKIDSLALMLSEPGGKLYLYNTNIRTLHVPNLETNMYSCTIYNCTGVRLSLISTSNITINGSDASLTNTFTIESSIVRIIDSIIPNVLGGKMVNSNVYLESSTIASSSGDLALYSSNVDVVGGEISGDDFILRAFDGSNVSIGSSCLLTKNGDRTAIVSASGSKVNIKTSSGLFNQSPPIGGYSYGLYCDNADIILESTDNLEILNNGTDPAIFVENGGKISLVNVTGTTNIPVNTLNAKGIIFSN